MFFMLYATKNLSKSQIPAVRQGFCLLLRNMSRMVGVSDPCCTAGLLFSVRTEDDKEFLSQIPAVRRGFCFLDCAINAEGDVSDPCCTAGFLLTICLETNILDSLRSLLYGGVFVDRP